MSIPADNDAFLSHSLGALLHLARRARQAGTTAELGFIAVNETLALAPYRQAALWVADRGVVALSGVVAPEANAPFVHWLERVLQKLLADKPKAADVTPADLATDEAAEWDEWLPAHALWLPLPHDTPGGLLLAAAVLLPFVGMLFGLLLGGRQVQRMAFVVIPVGLALAAAIASHWLRGGRTLVYLLGGWAPPLGIALRADGPAVAMLLAIAVVVCGGDLGRRHRLNPPPRLSSAATPQPHPPGQALLFPC